MTESSCQLPDFVDGGFLDCHTDDLSGLSGGAETLRSLASMSDQERKNLTQIATRGRANLALELVARGGSSGALRVAAAILY
jgi:hypothetical protein